MKGGAGGEESVRCHLCLGSVPDPLQHPNPGLIRTKQDNNQKKKKSHNLEALSDRILMGGEGGVLIRFLHTDFQANVIPA